MRRTAGTLHENLCTFMIIFCQIVISMRMFQTTVVEKIKTHILCSVTFFWKSCCLWDNVEKYGRARQATNDTTMWPMLFPCWITKAVDTRSECVIHIAFPWQQWLCECSSILHYTLLSCFVWKGKLWCIPCTWVSVSPYPSKNIK